MAKRKAKDTKTCHTINKRVRPTTTDTQSTSPLLKLAPELRNKIYAHVLQTEPQVYITNRKNCRLFSKSALARVSHQVRDEFNSLLQVAAFELVAEVNNFDFGHVVTFLNRMDERDLDTLATAPSERRMIIKLNVTNLYRSGSNYGKLKRWLNRLNAPNKKGSAIKFSYVVSSTDVDDVDSVHYAQWAKDMSQTVDPYTYRAAMSLPSTWADLSAGEKGKLGIASALRKSRRRFLAKNAVTTK